MDRKKLAYIVLTALIAESAAAAAPEAAKRYPERPVRRVTGSAGSTSDFVARFVQGRRLCAHRSRVGRDPGRVPARRDREVGQGDQGGGDYCAVMSFISKTTPIR